LGEDRVQHGDGHQDRLIFASHHLCHFLPCPRSFPFDNIIQYYG
jgi:hypothetical protein